MKFSNIRDHIATTSLIVSVLFLGPPAFAQAEVRVRTPGNAFTIVGSAGKSSDVTGGRQFRASAFEKLKIRGTLRVPPSRTGVARIQKLQRLAIRFRTSPRSPRLFSVKLCNGGSCPFTVSLDLAGDYTTKETIDTERARNANVWVFVPAESVDAKTVVELEVQFGGGIDSRVDNGEFLLVALDADYLSNP